MTQFDREHELVARVASAHTALWPAASPLRVLRAERGYGRGVADLMVLDFDPQAVAVRREGGASPVAGPSEAMVLAAIRGSGVASFESLAARMSDTSPRHLRLLLGRLRDLGHVAEDADGNVRSLTGQVLQRAIAVEAKLSDWRGGAIQASRYHSFANRSYLAMPEGPAIRLAAQRDVLDGLGIGVIAVGERVRVVVAAPDRPAVEPGVRCWAEEAELAALLGMPRRLVAPFTSRFTAPTPEQLVAGA